MQSPPLYAYVVIALLPPAIHFSAMLGRSLLSPIRSGNDLFDRYYNRWPWLTSVLCGLAGCLALASKDRAMAFAACLLALGALALVDLVGIMLSAYAWARRKR